MSNLDYLNENALRRYPFRDDADLHWTYTSEGILPNNIFLDAIFICTDGCPTLPRLSVIYRDVNASIFYIGIYVLEGYDSAGGFEFTITIGDTVAYAPSFDGKKYLKLTIDTDALNAYFDANVTDDYMVFDDTNNFFCASTIKLMAPQVTQISLDNMTGGATQIIATIDPTHNYELNEGTNVELSGTDKLIANVIAGAGKGLFNACEDLNKAIRRINDVGPGTFGNYGVTTDPCFKLEPGVATELISGICKPSCTEQELRNFAFYLNRVRNGLTDVITYVNQTKYNYDQLIATYAQKVEEQRAIKPAYIKASSATASNKAKDYHTISCAIYSPSKQELPVTLTVGYNEIFSLVEDSIYTKQEGVKKAQTTTGLSVVTKCNDVVYHGFVLNNNRVVEESPKNIGEQKFDVAFNLTSTQTAAYYSLPLLAITPNFTVSYTRTLGKENVKKIHLILDLLYKEGTSSNSSLIVNFPSEFELVKGSLIVNKTHITPITKMFGFDNVVIDYSKKATCVMDLICRTDSSTPIDVEMALTTGQGISRKVIPFLV